MAKRYMLCFHDLSVENFEKVVPTLFKLREIAGPFSVLVIPCVEKVSESKVAEFKAALKALLQEGFELALHGYKHVAEFSQGRSAIGNIALKMTNNEAEFAGLSEYESSRLLDLAMDSWNALLDDVKPVAFVPPTWYGNDYLSSQVRKQEMVFEERFVLVSKNGIRTPSPVTSFAGIPAWSENLAFAFGHAILNLPFCLPRIALHPVDFPLYEKEIFRLVEAASSKCKLVKYADF